MGLIGGFKAKFTRNRKQKQNTQEVVIPLHYRVKAEFDSQNPPDAVPIGLRSALRKPRTPLRLDTFTETSKTISEKLKSASLKNIVNNSSDSEIPKQEGSKKTYTDIGSDAYTETSKITSDKLTSASRKNIVNNSSYSGIPKQEGSKKTNTDIGSDTFTETSKTASDKLTSASLKNIVNNSSDSGIYKQEGSKKTYTDIGNYKKENFIPHTNNEKGDNNTIGNNSDSTLILMTQGSDSSSINNFRTSPQRFQPIPGVQVDNSFPINSNLSIESEEFKVNVVQHDQLYESEDEDVEESVDTSEYARPSFSYSKFATSIFFSDTEPTITRPRKIQFKSEDVDEGEEHDC